MLPESGLMFFVNKESDLLTSNKDFNFIDFYPIEGKIEDIIFS